MSKQNKPIKVFVIDPNQIKTRDYLLIDIINGATKSGVQIDRKKEQDRKACRKAVDKGGEDW